MTEAERTIRKMVTTLDGLIANPPEAVKSDFRTNLIDARRSLLNAVQLDQMRMSQRVTVPQEEYIRALCKDTNSRVPDFSRLSKADARSLIEALRVKQEGIRRKKYLQSLKQKNAPAGGKHRKMRV